ncbi:MFS transporter [Saccharopolyspora sp. NPDC047091]|uniref:MFS transporter n=1 Tax=Saccharopolyspora sp. NPDC047091 TaxID=3155924 RepID=UPI0034070825
MNTRLRAARIATFAHFVLCGFLMGMWIVHIPVVERAVRIDHALLGWLLLLLGAGAVAAMQLVGPLTDRFGARLVVPVSAAACSLAVVLPGLAVDGWTLGIALLVFGFCNGCLDVSMNAHAVQVERAYGRPVMSAFHAAFSVGGVAAALIGARTLGWGWSPATSLGAAAVLGLVLGAVAARGLLRPEPAPEPVESTSDGRRPVAGRVWLLAGLAFLIMLCEGVANDWSALHLRDVLGAQPATAALGYGAFATTMTAGRLLADRVAARVGPRVVLRGGAGIAAVGLTAAALSPWVPLALAGWAVFGVGLAGCVPQLLSAAGHADDAAAGANVSRVAGLGFVGMLAGPAVIGPLTYVVPLNLAFFLPVLCCVAAVAAARSALPDRRAPATSAPVR